MITPALKAKFEEDLVKAILTMLLVEKLITSAEFKAILEEQKKMS